MFDTWASYESTRAFVTSSFLWQRRGSNFRTAALAAWQPSNRFHTPQAPTGSNDAIQQKARAAFYFNWADDTPFVGNLVNTPIRVRPAQSEHSGQRIDACERLSPPRSNSSRDDENHPISGRSPPRKGHPREKMPLSPTKATVGSHCTSSR